MKISDISTRNQIDELDVGKIGKTAGSGVRAVGTGIKDFAKGFAQGFTGKSTEPNNSASTEKDPLGDIKSAIAKLSPKQIAALRTQIAQKAGVR